MRVPNNSKFVYPKGQFELYFKFKTKNLLKNYIFQNPLSVTGLKIFINNLVDFNNTKNVVVAATMLFLGLGGATLSITYGYLSISIYGMSFVAIISIILNIRILEEKTGMK